MLERAAALGGIGRPEPPAAAMLREPESTQAGGGGSRAERRRAAEEEARLAAAERKAEKRRKRELRNEARAATGERAPKKAKLAAAQHAAPGEAAEDDGAAEAPQQEGATEAPDADAIGSTFRAAFQQLHALAGATSLLARGREEGPDDKAVFDVHGAAELEPPVERQMELWGLDAQLGRNVRAMGIERLYPLQRQAVQQFLDSADNDLCISAPTGSGKTLVFALPVMAALLPRVVRRLRALVVLPTRELAAQCHRVFEALCVGTPLRAASGVGSGGGGAAALALGHTSWGSQPPAELDCDILVCTPGRLMDLLRLSSRFTLEHLTFLVVDEADRLLSQRYQGWLAGVYEAAFRSAPGRLEERALGDWSLEPTTTRRLGGASAIAHRPDEPRLRRILCSATLTRNPEKLASLKLRRPIHVAIRALPGAARAAPASAPAPAPALAAAAALAPAHDDEHEQDEEPQQDKASKQARARTQAQQDAAVPQRFLLPESLYSHFVVCPKPELKPLALAQLLDGALRGKPTLVFCASVQAAHRLALVLQAFFAEQMLHVGELSSSQGQAERSKVLRRFARGACPVLVASDLMARGIDLDNLFAVVNYDLPSYDKAFVHRVGRVARAGREGHAYTLVRKDQTGIFRKMTLKMQGRAPGKLALDKEWSTEHGPQMERALADMKKTAELEIKRHRKGLR